MPNRGPRLLDLGCGAGGGSCGYQQAGFRVYGVDHRAQPDYPYRYWVLDMLYILGDRDFLDQFDVVHASPPCPRDSTMTPARFRAGWPDLITPVRSVLANWGGTYIIENVPQAPLQHPVTLCGASFGLGVTCRDGNYRPLRRHRIFESNATLTPLPCLCDHRQALGVYGTGGGGENFRPGTTRSRGYRAWTSEAKEAMEVPWMTRAQDVANALPPAYTRFVGKQVMATIGVR